MNVAALISGGKDSALALYRVLRSGHNVKYLATMVPQREDSWMFHYPNIRLTDLFAEAVGISLVKTKTAGIEEEEVEDLKRLLGTLDVEGIVSGAVFSEYQKTRIDRICKELGFMSIAPLWHEDPAKLMNELIEQGFHAIITGVYAHGFDAGWLGRRIDTGSLSDLIELKRKYQVSIIGEGGEYETLVVDAPYFRKEIQIIKAKTVWEGDSGYLLVEEARLRRK
ncbi:MAG: TIGR00289 family protein [Candidatus Bathyarchaeota archaeon]|nr:TIGR00289 family protein [Candidatus Bathyarchaeota archaeon]